jgi:AraC family transcriptional regulator
MMAGNSRAQSAVLPRYPATQEFSLEETSLDFSSHRRIVASSDGLGWSDLAVAVTEVSPFEGRTPRLTSLWLTLPYNDAHSELNRNGRVFKGIMARNSVSLAAPGIDDRIILLNTIHCLNVFIRESMITEIAGQMYRRPVRNVEILSFAGAVDPALSYLLRACRELLADPDGSHYRNAYLAQAIAAQVLARHAQLHDLPLSSGVRSTLSAAQMRRIDEFLESHLGGNFQFGELATSIGLSRTIFFSRFLATTGRTPHQYLQVLRVNRARRLLEETSASLAEIAVAAGFSDQSHLARFFKRHFGVSPGRHRACRSG